MSVKVHMVVALSMLGLPAGISGHAQLNASVVHSKHLNPLSPELTPDHRLVFRIFAPNAKLVSLVDGDLYLHRGQKYPPEFTKNGEGIWEARSEPLPGGAYRYLIQLDGIPTVDPQNPEVSESNSNVWSLAVVPGNGFADDRNDVSHGSVSTIYYYSAVLGHQRRMHIYTPPGYEKDSRRLPVLYLLHGSSDSDDTWTSVGRAGFILDNLIATKKAVPMIIVMPAGHILIGEDNMPSPEERHEFLEEFANDIMPYVNKNYRVLADRDHTAIAGVSMGGEQAIDLSMAHLERFAYVGVWSAGLFEQSHRLPIRRESGPIRVAPEWVEEHSDVLDNTKLKPGMKLFWFGVGSDDGLLPIAKATYNMFQDHGFRPVFVESGGGHGWSNWREYLDEFAPQLFR